MPQAPGELRKKIEEYFGDGVSDALPSAFLAQRGYLLTRKWEWITPSPYHKITQQEADCIDFLYEEWDYGGLWWKYITPRHIQQPKIFYDPPFFDG